MWTEVLMRTASKMSGQRLSNFPDDLHLLSSQEFSRKLTLWFEDQGIVSDLLAHLRAQLISALRGTSFVAKPSKRSTSSPKFHALNLLIAEYLLQQGHHYTLSVFAGEVPLQGFATETSVGKVTRGEIKSDEEGPPRFHRRDIWDILETFGFAQGSEESNRLYGMYQDNQGEALLTCIFRILPALSQNRLEKNNSETTVKDKNELAANQTALPPEEVEDKTKNLNNIKQNENSTPEAAFEDIIEILNESNLKNDKKAVLHKKINFLIKLEASRIKREAEQRYDRNLIERERIIQANLIERDNLLKRCLSRSEEKITKEKQEIENSKQEMAVVTTQLRQSHEHITRSFHELDERQEMLRMREVEMERLRQLETARFTDQANDLDTQKQTLDRELKRLEEEKAEIQSLHSQVFELRRNFDIANHALTESQSQVAFLNDLQHQCSYLRKELHSSKQYLKQLSANAKHKTPGVSTKPYQVTRSQQTDQLTDDVPGQNQTSGPVAIGMLQHFQQENAELRMHLHQQEERIQEVTAHAIRLAMEVEEAQSSLAHVTGHNGAQTVQSFMATESGTILPTVASAEEQPPPPPPPPPLPARSTVPLYLGGGEESLSQAPTSIQTPTPVEPRETRRKPPRRLVIHNATSSDESSPTDEVLQEARRRLRTLEEESAEVDRRFRDFKRRQALFFESTPTVFGAMVHPGVSQGHKDSNLPDQHLGRSSVPSLNPTFYGASSSGLSRSRNFEVHQRMSVSHLFPRSSGSETSPPLGKTSLASTKPYFGRMIDIFRSSPSSDSDSPYPFSHQIHSKPRPSTSVTRQTQTIEEFENITHSNEDVPTTLSYINYAYRREQDIQSYISTNSVPKQLVKKVHFSQEPSVVISSTQSSPQHKPSLPNTSPDKTVLQLDSNFVEVENKVEDNDKPVTSYISIESNAVERNELEQALLNDRKKFADFEESNDSLQKEEHDTSQADSFNPDVHSSLLEPSCVDQPHSAQSPDEKVPPVQDKLELPPEKPENGSVLVTNLKAVENDSEIVDGNILQSTNHKLPPISPQLNVVDESLNNNATDSSPSQQQNSTKDAESTHLQKQMEADTSATIPVEETATSNLTKDSTMMQSGSGSGFTSSVGKLSLSSLMLSSDTQPDEVEVRNVQENQQPAVETPVSETEANKPVQTTLQMIVEPINVPLLVSDEEQSIKTPSDENMSAPEVSNEDNFWD